MHVRTDKAAAKVIGRKCSIHYVEEYSRRRNYNRTFDLWIWTDEPRAIPRGGTFAITSADEEGLATDIPLPDLEPLRNPPPSEPKKGWTYNVLVHVDTLEDLLSHKARAYKWDYDVQDDGTRYREYPLPCRAEPDPTRGPADDDEDKDRDNHSRSRHRSGSLWDRLRRRSSSRSREPDRRDGHRQDNENRGRPRNRERSEHRSRSCRSRDPSEVRPPFSSRSISQDDSVQATLPLSSTPSASPCKLQDSLRSLSPDGGAAASPSLNQHIPDQSILQADSCFSSQGSEEVLTLLESHLDPMLHLFARHILSGCCFPCFCAFFCSTGNLARGVGGNPGKPCPGVHCCSVNTSAAASPACSGNTSSPSGKSKGDNPGAFFS